jgi:hypothetical protein
VKDPFQALFDPGGLSSAFPQQSRYHRVEIAMLELPDGRRVAHLRRRFIPPGDELTAIKEHLVRAGERIDHIAASELGDPELFWQLCDANDAMEPAELTREPGRSIKISLPEGFKP